MTPARAKCCLFDASYGRVCRVLQTARFSLLIVRFMKTGRDTPCPSFVENARPSRSRRSGEGAASALEQLKQEHAEMQQPEEPATPAFNVGDEQATPA